MRERIYVKSAKDAYPIAGVACVMAGVVILMSPNADKGQHSEEIAQHAFISDESASAYPPIPHSSESIRLEASTSAVAPETSAAIPEPSYDPVCRQESVALTESEQRDLMLHGMNADLETALELQDGTDSLAMYIAIDPTQDADFSTARLGRSVFGMIASAAGYAETPIFEHLDPAVENLEPGTVIIVASAGDC